ncbi:MAG: dockerin type I repeat-containing protein [Clostridiales bacterium]|nr:dockerin type I repeat-containing protein [Clostridiales bacterium]
MKKSTKILSVFMSLLLVFSCIPMTAMATDRDTSSLDAYLSNENLAAVAETLLTDLGDRKETVVPTVLNLVFQLVPDLKTQAESDGLDVFNASAEDLASSLVAYLDNMLEELDLNSSIGSYSTLIGLIGIDVSDLNSVNGFMATLASLDSLLSSSGASRTYGDLADLDLAAIQALDNDSTDLDTIYALVDFLADEDNIAVIKKAVLGELDLGTINGTINTFASFDIEGTVNDFMGNLDVTIKELIYNYLIADKVEVTAEDGTVTEEIETAYADSDYYSFTSDELLAAALIKLINGEDVSQTEASAAAAMTLYELIGAYADVAIANYAIEPLNTTVKDALTDLCDMDPQLEVLKDILNLDYEFTTDTFNFTDMAEEGLFENLNNLVCKIVEVMVQPEVYEELGLVEGGNENITANLTSFLGYVLKTLASNNGGLLEFTINETAYSYDFSQFTEENIASQSLEDMVVAVLKLFFPGWFGEDVPETIDTLEEMAAYAAYKAIDTWMPDDFVLDSGYKDLVYNSDGSFKDFNVDDGVWVDLIGEMGMDVAIYWLSGATTYEIDQTTAQSLKADGWTWEDFLESVVDWALNYIDGVPAVADVLETEVTEIDGYGAWYKLNVVLNELIPLDFVNDCGDETFTFDTYTFLIEKAVPSLFECDFEAFADILAANDSEDNLFNKSVISSTLELVDGLIFALFEHTCGTTGTFEKAATETRDGYSGTYDTANGHYIDVTVIEATGTEEPTTEPATEEPTTEEPTMEPTDEPTTEPATDEPTTEPSGSDVMKGDVNGDGKVSAADARSALRIAASLDEATDDALAAGDLDGNGKITAAEARRILRVAASLDTFDD